MRLVAVSANSADSTFIRHNLRANFVSVRDSYPDTSRVAAK